VKTSSTDRPRAPASTASACAIVTPARGRRTHDAVGGSACGSGATEASATAVDMWHRC
jgi:hypothetical protein